MNTSHSVIRTNFRLFYLIVVAGVLIMPARAQTPSPAPTPPAVQTPLATPSANPADVATMNSIIAALYDVISGPAGKRDWD